MLSLLLSGMLARKHDLCDIPADLQLNISVSGGVARRKTSETHRPTLGVHVTFPTEMNNRSSGQLECD